MKFVLRVYYKKIYFLNECKIPYHKPYILACNHPNAFTDAIIIAALTKKELHFLARSDVFNNKLNRWLLGLINLIPIYRLQEGSESLKKNEDTFGICYEILSKGDSILVFSEGISIQEKKLRPLKKGTARIAFGALEQNAEHFDLQIVPVGINYTHPNNFRKEVIISFGDSINVQDHYKRYLANNAKGVNALNAAMAEAISAQMVLVQNKDRELSADLLLEIVRNNYPAPSHPWLSKNVSRLTMEKMLANRINHLDDHDNLTLSKYREKYKAGLQKLGIDDAILINSTEKAGWQLVMLMLLAPPAFSGAVLNFLPFVFTKTISGKFVKKGEFYSGVNICAGSILFIIYYTFITIVLVRYFGWLGVFLNGIPLLLGYFALHWWETTTHKLNLLRRSRLLKSNPDLFEKLLKLRDNIYRLCVHSGVSGP